MENDSIVFTDEDGNEVAFSVMEQTTLGGVNYLLVTEDGDDEDDGSFLIVKVRWQHLTSLKMTKN